MEQAFLRWPILWCSNRAMSTSFSVVFNVNVSQGLCKDKVSLYMCSQRLAQSWMQSGCSVMVSVTELHREQESSDSSGLDHETCWLVCCSLTVSRLPGTLPSLHALFVTPPPTTPQNHRAPSSRGRFCGNADTWRDPGSVCFVCWNWQQLKSIYLENPQR